jgi:hypothetical protein
MMEVMGEDGAEGTEEGAEMAVAEMAVAEMEVVANIQGHELVLLGLFYIGTLNQYISPTNYM